MRDYGTPDNPAGADRMLGQLLDADIAELNEATVA